MRILHLSSLYPPHVVGGAEKVVEIVAERTAALGLDVGVAHLSPEPTDRVERNGVEVSALAHRNPLWIGESANYRSPIRNLNKLATLFNIFTARDFSRLLETFRPDIVHSHSMVELPPAIWQGVNASGAALVHTLHDYDLLCIRGSLFKDGRRCLTRHTACAAFSWVKHWYHKNIDSVVGVSESILKTHIEYDFFSHTGVDSRYVVWNPVSQPLTVLSRPQRDPEKPFTFGFLGRLVAEKGIGELLDACRKLPANGWRLMVGGKAPAGDSEWRLRAEGMPVEFCGYVDPNQFFSDIDVLVVPSVWIEPFGLTVLEAYSAGIKVLGANVGGVAEIVGSVDPGALYDISDPNALPRAMSELMLGNSSQFVPVQSRTEALQRTSPDNVAGEYIRIYQDTLARKKSKV